MSMTADEAFAYIGGWVRFKDDGAPHFSMARVISTNGKTAKVRPTGSSKDVDVPVDKLQPWTSRNTQVGFVPKATPIKAVTPQPIAVKADSAPAVKGGVIEDVSAMVARMGDLEREVDEMQQLEAICKADYDAAKAAADASRAGLAETRRELKLRLGL